MGSTPVGSDSYFSSEPPPVSLTEKIVRSFSRENKFIVLAIYQNLKQSRMVSHEDH